MITVTDAKTITKEEMSEFLVVERTSSNPGTFLNFDEEKTGFA